MDPHFADLGRKSQEARRRAMARRRREARAEAERQMQAQARDELLKFGLLSLVADRVIPAPKKDEPGAGYGLGERR
ncbi:MAG: hypothetical protein A3K66_04325 [Euryarchaeota archaeon RBG_16_67_27]|nr:MAG: hypothetical protein A3K66_04325 [Euryarchaeota archaeon RBG_16_67_27]